VWETGEATLQKLFDGGDDFLRPLSADPIDQGTPGGTEDIVHGDASVREEVGSGSRQCAERAKPEANDNGYLPAPHIDVMKRGARTDQITSRLLNNASFQFQGEDEMRAAIRYDAPQAIAAGHIAPLNREMLDPGSQRAERFYQLDLRPASAPFVQVNHVLLYVAVVVQLGEKVRSAG
jgi:hypothetical protein